MGYARTSYNTRYTLRRLTAARATKKPSRACALGGFFLRLILRLLVFATQSPYSQPQNVVYLCALCESCAKNCIKNKKCAYGAVGKNIM